MTKGFITKTIAFSYQQDLQRPASFSSRPFVPLLEKCSGLTHLKEIHAHTIASGLTRFTYFASRILASYADLGAMDDACQLFDIIPSPTIFNWNTMIRGFSDSPEPQRALFLYYKMRRSTVEPNMHSFPFVVKSCTNLPSLSHIHAQVFIFGFNLDVYVTSSLIGSYSSLGKMELAYEVFDKCSNRNIACWTSLISGYCRHALLDRARELFDIMPEKSDVSWSAMVAGYVQNECYEEAMELFLELKVSGSVKLNGSLLVSALRACAAMGAFVEGRWIHSYVDDKGFEYGLELGTALLDFYAKCGCIEYARKVFDRMPGKDLVAWSAMIAGLAFNGYCQSAVQVFSEMLRNKVKPNAVTFIGLLAACNHGGLVDEGMTNFKDMEKVYGISPTIEHYGCMVDLLSRAGKMKEAKQIIIAMPMEPDGAILGALLNGCFVHGDNELGEIVGRDMIKLDPDHCGRYVGLANVYAAMGKWDGVAKVRSAMKERRVMAITGWSLIEVNGSTHRFLANDNTHPMLDEIQHMLSDLIIDIVLNFGLQRWGKSSEAVSRKSNFKM